MNVGFTFSERQADALRLPWQQTYRAAMDLSPNVVRLGAYFDAIEPQPGMFDFSSLDWLLDNTPRQSTVVLTVGMKAPRWPEYYLPGWLTREAQVPRGAEVSADATVQRETLRFIQQVVERYRDRPIVGYWQIENEPFESAGPRHWRIGAGFLAEEAALVRSLDRSRPLVMSMFLDTSPLGLMPNQRGPAMDRARTLASLADVVGIDIYPMLPVWIKRHALSIPWPAWVWEGRAVAIQRMARSAGKQAWISEAQAEPWMRMSVASNTTISAVDHLHADGFDTILLWGVEYWYSRAEHFDDPGLWQQMKGLFPAA